MSTVRTNNVQVGQSLTATNNFTLYQPTVPDGTVRLGVGNTGATTLDAVTVNNAGNVSVPSLTVNSNNISSVNSLGFRNRIINGDFRINQRGVTSVAGGSEVYTLDRWIVANYFLSGAVSVAQSSDAPAGFTNSLLVTNGTGEALAAGDFGSIRQKIEGFNVADLAWGTASAVPITISFWVKSSVTGNYSVGLINNALNRANRTVFTINAANTWEQKTVQFSGDTTGTWVTNNGIGLYVDVVLVAGSNQHAAANTWTANALEGVSGASANWVTSTNATFFITGVQLEAGTVASPFERRDYGRELAMCQRYFCKTMDQNTVPANGLSGGANGYIYITPNATNAKVAATWKYPVTMRAIPTITTFGYAGAASNTWRNIDNSNNGPTITAFNTGQEMVGLYGDGTVTAWAAGQGYVGAATASAEL